MLRSMRQVAAAMAAPGVGAGGQHLDIALVVADGSSEGRADPAFDAHMMPIGEWAMACWENWITDGAMDVIVGAAKEMVAAARNQWARACGPGVAMVMSCMRLGWEVITARHLVTHDGEHLHLKLDPPAVVLQKVIEAVKRWRWLRIEQSCPQLAANGAGRGALMEPIWQLLNSKAADENWKESTRRGCDQPWLEGSIRSRGPSDVDGPDMISVWPASADLSKVIRHTWEANALQGAR